MDQPSGRAESRTAKAHIRYFQAALARKGGKCLRMSETEFQLPFRISTDREAAKEDEEISLLGLEHPIVKQLLDEDRKLEGGERALTASNGEDVKGLLTVWHVSLQDSAQRYVQRIIPIGLDNQGKRNKTIESLVTSFGGLRPASESILTPTARTGLVRTKISDMLRRDLDHKGLLSESVTISWRLLAWIELN